MCIAVWDHSSTRSLIEESGIKYSMILILECIISWNNSIKKKGGGLYLITSRSSAKKDWITGNVINLVRSINFSGKVFVRKCGSHSSELSFFSLFINITIWFFFFNLFSFEHKLSLYNLIIFFCYWRIPKSLNLPL